MNLDRFAQGLPDPQEQEIEEEPDHELLAWDYVTKETPEKTIDIAEIIEKIYIEQGVEVDWSIVERKAENWEEDEG